MTGEMSYADPEEYPHHFAAAARVGGKVYPFDVYQGPYILHNGRRYWLIGDDGAFGEWYCTETERYSHEFLCCSDDTEMAVDCLADMIETGGFELPHDKRAEQCEAAERQAVDIG